jgi:hypothetical protein
MSYSLSIKNKIIDFINNNVSDEQIKVNFFSNLKNDLEKRNNEVLEKLVRIFHLLDLLNLHDHLDEFLKGAHFIIYDKGLLYDELKNHCYERISSHHKDKIKAESDCGIVAGKSISQLLMGKTESMTWFQIENSAMPSLSEIFTSFESFYNFISHAKDFLVYAGTGKNVNIGQYGFSWYPEKAPIIIEKSALVISETASFMDGLPKVELSYIEYFTNQ